jgi:SAM-dependent methyltransferase
VIDEQEWFKKICASYSNPPALLNGNVLPAFPPDQIQINTTGQAGINTLKEAFIFYQDCLETFDRLGAPLQAHHKVLDFGAGWGRISRFFLSTVPLENIYGLDVMEQFVQICRETFKSDNFAVCNPFPPTSIPDGNMNFIVGYSVFSHLSEQACASWMQEFARILAPGGIVALTTRGRPFFDYCERLREQHATGYLGALSRLFDDFNDARACYDNSEFVHATSDGVSGGNAMTSDFYGETWIPETYASNAYADLFELKTFLFEPPRQTQPIMFFRRK